MSKKYRSCSVSFSDEDKTRLANVSSSLLPLFQNRGGSNDSACLRFLIEAAPVLYAAVNAVEVPEDISAVSNPDDLLRMKWFIYKKKFEDN